MSNPDLTTGDRLPPGVYIVGLGTKEILHVTLETNHLLGQMETVVFVDPGSEVDGYLRTLGVKERHNLLHAYAEGTNRRDSYLRIVDFIQERARGGGRVCYLAPGNPIFLNNIVEALIERGSAAGTGVHVYSGVSSLDTVLTDLQLPAGRTGLQVYDATTFYRQKPKIDIDIPLLLFQPGVFLDPTIRLRRAPEPGSLRPLASYLSELYPPTARWLLVGSSKALGSRARVIWNRLSALDDFSSVMLSGTLVFPGKWWPPWLETEATHQSAQ